MNTTRRENAISESDDECRPVEIDALNSALRLHRKTTTNDRAKNNRACVSFS